MLQPERIQIRFIGISFRKTILSWFTQLCGVFSMHWFDLIWLMLYGTGDGYWDDEDRCTKGPLVETNNQNTKHLVNIIQLTLYITDKHEQNYDPS